MFLLAALAWFFAAVGVRGEPVAYEVTPVVEAGSLRAVEVTMTFSGDADGRTRVRLPAAWAGTRRLDRTVVEVEADGARLTRRGSDITLSHRPGAPVRLTYRVAQDYSGPPRVGFDRPYRPSTIPEGFTLIGWTVFGPVEARERDGATFRWGPAPAGWALASDLDHAAGARIDVETLSDSVLVGGRDLELVTFQAAGGQVRVAVLGGWRFSADALADRYGRMVEASADFWGEGRRPFFLALTPLAGPPGAGAQSGLGLGDGLAIWLSSDSALDEASHVLVHEQQHAWMPDRLGGLSVGGSEALDFWFSEGFTDFYTLRILLRAGLSTPEAHLEALNRALRIQAEAPPGLRNADVARAFFNDRRIAGLPYQRGLLLALAIDARLRRASGGLRDLDDAILAMRSGQGAAPARLIRAYGEIGGEDLRPLLHQAIDEGRPIRLDPGLFGDCALVTLERGVERLIPGPGLRDERREACIRRMAGQ
jgi:predicted metalloprotease with PDZ domain